MKPDEFASCLQAVLTKRYRPVAGCLITAALGRDNDAWVMITGRVVFHDSAIEPRACAAYPTLRLEERWLEADRAVTVLHDLLQGRQVAELGMTMSSDYISEPYNPPELGGETGWPECVYIVRLDHDVARRAMPRGPVVAHGLSPYDTGAVAIMDWFQTERAWEGGEPRHLGVVRVVIPDTRARIAKARWVSAGAEVEVNSAVSRNLLQLQAVTQAGGRQTLRIFDTPQADTLVQLSLEAKRLSLFLVHADTTLLGRVDLSSPGEDFLADRGPGSPEALFAQDLRHGENDEVEFKPFIETGSVKDGEVIRTLVAFANSKGGRLYVGLRDDGVPLGEAALCKAVKASPAEAREALTRRYEKIVRERIKPVPKTELVWLEHAGSPVLAVYTLRADDGPVSTHDNEIWIRKGATNRRPDPKTELPEIYERTRKTLSSWLMRAPLETE